ncbi:hypothetical protein DFR50_12590 [Roseiarcus fermentans]|uniref:Uncharacterized protein n=1 Tax=Roseiarcus fermentans TaxID=1473586 RepID=A0A366F1S9_9HYPH|nr:hypothetical protein [Roseiarcus fermentans]RBP08608.1 hypothetical protein DFR50_12590 [Roseiarcus fermentans]
MNKSATYSVHCAMDGYWVVDSDRALVGCSDLDAARLIAALMNGDLEALAAGANPAVDACLGAILDMFRPLRRAGRPMLDAPVPCL